MLESKKVLFLKASIGVTAASTELDDSNPLDSSPSSSVIVGQAEGSTTTVDDMVDATDETSLSDNNDKTKSGDENEKMKSRDDQGMCINMQ